MCWTYVYDIATSVDLYVDHAVNSAHLQKEQMVEKFQTRHDEDICFGSSSQTNC